MAEAEIELTESTLVIHLKGLGAKILAFLNFWGSGPLEIPLAHVVDVTVDPETWETLGIDPSWQRGLKFPGELSLEREQEFGRRLYYEKKPDRQSEGKVFGVPFTFTYRRGRTALVLTNNKRKAITIRLSDERDTLLVLPVTDPAGTAARIREAVQAYKSS
jgi:hypothetical protein